MKTFEVLVTTIFIILFIFYLFFASRGLSQFNSKQTKINLKNLQSIMEEEEYFLINRIETKLRIENILNGIFDEALDYIYSGLKIEDVTDLQIFKKEFTKYGRYDERVNFFTFSLEIINLPIIFLMSQNKNITTNDYLTFLKKDSIKSLKKDYYFNEIFRDPFWFDEELDLNFFDYQSKFLIQSINSLIGLINYDLENPNNLIMSKKYNQSKNYYLKKRLSEFNPEMKKIEIIVSLNNTLQSCYFGISWITFISILIIYYLIYFIIYRNSEKYYFQKYIYVVER